MMNKYLLLIILIVPMACCDKKPKETIIMGTFLNYKDSIVYLHDNGLIDTIVLDKNKSFTHKVIIDKPNYYCFRLQDVGYGFYAKPKDIISFSLDCVDEQNQPKFKGTYADINNYLQHSNLIMDDFYHNWDAGPENNKPFSYRLDSVDKLLNAILDSASITDPEIQSLEKYRIGYFIKKMKVERKEINTMRFRTKINHSIEDYSFWKDLDVNNPYHLMFDDYIFNVERYIRHLFKKNHKNESDSIESADDEKMNYFAFIDSTVSNQDVRDLIKMKCLMEEMNIRTFMNEKNTINKYLSDCQNNICKSVVWNSYYKLMLSMFESSASNLSIEAYLLYINNCMDEDIKNSGFDLYYELKTLADFFTFIDDKLTNRPLRELIKTVRLRDNLQYGKFYDFGEIMNKYLSDCQNKTYKLIILNLYKQRMLLSPGKKAPDFNIKDIQGNKYTLKDFKGSLLYMDIWGMG